MASLFNKLAIASVTFGKRFSKFPGEIRYDFSLF